MSETLNFILDQSLVPCWLFKDQETSFSNHILRSITNENKIYVSDFFFFDTHILLNNLVLNKEIDTEYRKRFLSLIQRLPLIKVTETDFEYAYFLASKYRLTIQQALNLKLSAKFSLPIAATNEQLNKIANEIEVETLSEKFYKMKLNVTRIHNES